MRARKQHWIQKIESATWRELQNRQCAVYNNIHSKSRLAFIFPLTIRAGGVSVYTHMSAPIYVWATMNAMRVIAVCDNVYDLSWPNCTANENGIFNRSWRATRGWRTYEVKHVSDLLKSKLIDSPCYYVMAQTLLYIIV